jgi:DNA-binding NarL/FixJ family response regulator
LNSRGPNSHVPNQHGDRPPGRILVGVIEEHPLYREAVARILEQAPDIESGVVAESVATFAAGRQPAGGIVLLDMRRDVAGVLAVAGMGHRVLVVSANGGHADVLGAMAAGARGYLSQDADGGEILRAIRAIAAGHSYVSPILAGFVLHSARPHQRTGPRIELSAQERRVLSLVAAGERDADIAEEMAISIRTVRSYLDRIRDKTGRRRRPELTRFAIEEGIAHQLPGAT